MEQIKAFESIIIIAFELWKQNEGKLPLEISQMLFGNLNKLSEDIVHIIVTTLISQDLLKQSELVSAIGNSKVKELIQEKFVHIDNIGLRLCLNHHGFNGTIPDMAPYVIQRTSLKPLILELANKFKRQGL
jgi:hypothetical protein